MGHAHMANGVLSCIKKLPDLNKFGRLLYSIDYHHINKHNIVYIT